MRTVCIIFWTAILFALTQTLRIFPLLIWPALATLLAIGLFRALSPRHNSARRIEYALVFLGCLALGLEMLLDQFAAGKWPLVQTLAGGMVDHTVRLWEVSTGKESRRFQGHKDRVLSVAFSSDGKRLAAGGQDATALVWDVTGR